MTRSSRWFAILLFVLVGVWIASSSLGVEAAMSPAPETSTIKSPKFTADNRIVFGTKGVWLKPKYGQMVFSIDNDAIGTFFEMFNLGKGELPTVFFLDKKQEASGNSSTFSAEVRDATSNEVKLGTYEMVLTLLDNGLIEVKSVCSLDEPARLESRYAILDLPDYLELSGEYVKDGKVTPFNDSAPLTLSEADLVDAQIRFFPETGARSFTVIPVECLQMTITGSRISFRPGKGKTLSFLLDIRGQQDAAQPPELSPNGIDFWGVDRLRLPDYGANRNLIMNPSFEAGLRYWGFPIYVHSAIPLKHTGVFELDGEVSRTGSHSLRLKALPVRSPLSIGHFPTPFVPGEAYTYSFYAKTTSGNSATLNVWGRGQIPQLFPDNVLTFKVDDEWKRYSIPFVATERFSSIYMDARSMDPTAEDDQFIWVDDVQLEKGDVTDFTPQPVAAELISAARGNFLEFDQAPDFKLNVQTLPDTEGTVAIRVEDYFFNTVFQGDYTFETDESGFASIDLNELSEVVVANGLRGVWSVSAEFTVVGMDRPFKDYFRFSVMDFLDNTHKNKDIFNLTYVYSLQAGGPEMERFMQRERNIGFGSICYDFVKFANDLDYGLDEERMALVEKYGFGYMGRPVLKLHDGEGGEISERQGEIKMQGVKNMIDPTDEQLAEFEAIVETKARNRPWNKIWWFTGESNPGVMPLESYPDAFAKFLLATYRGVKKGNPEAEVLIEGGPWTMEPQYGGEWTERYIKDTRRLDPTIKFDGAAAHHYRNFPENPDLDSDIAAFLEMLDRNGCSDWPFHVNEGGNYVPFNIPQEGISPYVVHSGNSWYIGPLSYDIGKAERITAAFSARNWLIGLKYADRVVCMQDFNTPNRYVDIDFTSRPYDKIPNTLGRLLGNATFYRDIRFAPDSRCYVFTDDKSGTPIASIWGHKESVDRWKEDAPIYKFDFDDLDVTFVDLMENEVDFSIDSQGRTAIPLSPFPIFIKSKPGTEAQLCEVIVGAVASSSIETALDVSAIPTGLGEASVVFQNTVSKPFEGEAAITVNDRPSTLKLRIPPLKETQTRIALDRAAEEYGKPLAFDFTCAIDGKPAQELSNAYMLLKYDGRVGTSSDGKGASWDSVPAIDLGSGVSIKVKVSNRRLWVAMESKGNKSSAADIFAGVGFYVDPFEKVDGWDTPKTAKQDLAVFELINGTSGGLEAMCHYVQGTQAGSGTDFLVRNRVQKAIEVNVSDTPDSAIVVFSVPQDVLAPLRLIPGSRFGFNLTLPRKSQDVISLAPIKGFKSPHEPGQMDMILVLVCK